MRRIITKVAAYVRASDALVDMAKAHLLPGSTVHWHRGGAIQEGEIITVNGWSGHSITVHARNARTGKTVRLALADLREVRVEADRNG